MHTRAEAQWAYGAARESHNEWTWNTLKHSTCSHKWWETHEGSIFGVNLSIPALRGPQVVWWLLQLRKLHSWTFSLTVSRVVSSSSHLCLVSHSLGVILSLLHSCPSASASWSWHMRPCRSYRCVNSISKDGCGCYWFKTKHNFCRLISRWSLPECWQSANVTAIPKGAPSPDWENYRPISLTPILSMVYEKFVSHKLSSFCFARNITFCLLLSLLIGKVWAVLMHC